MTNQKLKKITQILKCLSKLLCIKEKINCEIRNYLSIAKIHITLD